mmetsp:Transcript_14015/g.30322  ORF Transcript_14015/g.30322 Transcript_14015/m.30322 type:complete len:247 (-) Transcript_14015:792-1532(-)
MEPLRFVSSIRSIVQIRLDCLPSNLQSPSTWFTVGAWPAWGSGMTMLTFCRSKSAELSYSMFTYDCPPETDGQQLMVRGTKDSSLDCMRHFRMPSSDPVGKGRDASFRPRTFELLYCALSMFGCVLNWKALLAPDVTCTRMNASSSLLTTSDIVPCTSKFSQPPCLSSCTDTFSSTTRETGSFDMMIGAAEAAGLLVSSSTGTPSFARDSRISLPFFDLPSCMPFEGPLGTGADVLLNVGAGSFLP